MNYFLNFSLCFTIIWVLIWFLTYGTGDLLQGELFGVAYDSLAKNLLQGNSSVDPYTILYESFIINGKTYMYFGPFPALLRILSNLVFPSLYGKWSRLSCLLASVLCILAFTLMVRQQLQKNTYLSETQKSFFFYTSLIGFGLGTPVLFLISCGHIYHEAILWGLCSSTWGIYFLISLLNSKNLSNLNLLGLSFCAGTALLSKITFGIPLYLILSLVIIKNFIDVCYNRKTFGKNLLRLFLLISPALVALCFQLWYNYDRFGSISSTLGERENLTGYKGYGTLKPNNYSEILFFEDFGWINIKRVPSGLLNYFDLSRGFFYKEFPFVRTLNFVYYLPDLYLPALINYFIPLILVSAWIFIGGVLGFIWLLVHKNILLIKVSALILLFQVLVIASFLGTTHRYSAEFIPLLAFTYSFYLLHLGKQKHFKTYRNNLMVFSIIICITSITLTILNTLQWTCEYNVDASGIHRQNIKNHFNSVNQYLIHILERKK